MPEKAPARTILALDVGAHTTHGALLEPVEGAHRLLACAATPTASQPQVDLAESLRRCVKRLGELAERRLLDDEGAPILPRQGAKGVDVLAAACSAAPPLTCALVGLTDELSLQAGLEACRAGGAAVTSRFSLALAAGQPALAALLEQPPDVIVLVGGVDAGPTRPLLAAAEQLAALYADVEPEERPVVLFAGNQEARRPIAGALGGEFDYRVVDNLMPTMGGRRPQELQRELAQLYAAIRLPQTAGYGPLTAWATAPILSSHAGLTTMLQFLSRQSDPPRRALGLELDSSRAAATLAGERLVWSQRALDAPLGADDLLPLQALARELLGELAQAADGPVGDGWAVDWIVARGEALVQAKSSAQAALTLLDAVQPLGVARLALDWASLWPALGALAQVEPLAALQVWQRDATLELGSVVSLPGQGRKGRLAARLRLVDNTGRVQRAALRWGYLARLDLPLGASAALELEPARGLGRQLGALRQLSVRGGSLGVIVDARGRPPAQNEDAEARGGQVQRWLEELSS